MNEKDHIDLLREYFVDLEKMLQLLDRSSKKAKETGKHGEYSMEDYDILEAFTARFSRLADFLASKFLRTILILLRDDNIAFIDRANFFRKNGGHSFR